MFEKIDEYYPNISIKHGLTLNKTGTVDTLHSNKMVTMLPGHYRNTCYNRKIFKQN